MAPDFHRELQALRPELVRYASYLLRAPQAAEDAVQETLLAALAAPAAFGERSSLRTWLTGILKHKCIDVVRREQRLAPAAAPDAETAAEEFEDLFDEKEHWREHPHEWASPEAALQQKQFLSALESCLSHLPRRTVQVFLLREQMGREIDEICRDLGLSAANCSVLLHRSRMALRLCLQKNWFHA
ncbi:RNA polymerase factor sigma-70 [Ramlibacter monticola]|uniref:Sigma-70 family RNA polymerase sigma factor n=1 Tax=Ramlibacter monticola TaxID=1926872 RepID=A0A937CP16_9BURK|nr:sigma-70 family RNA polymerase sigma factor [Ramlibacter monticola]MBL0389685.1 sigma-70 family RNA polymerase sigma factor [Ramlibacter monticola]